MSRQAHRGRPEDDALEYDTRWAWREAQRLALKLRNDTTVIYPILSAERLGRFQAVVEQLELIGVAFSPQIQVDGDAVTVLLVPSDGQRASWERCPR